MSLGYAAMVSDDDAMGAARDCRVGGPSASRYFLVVLRWIPNPRSIARSDIPLRRAFCIAFHLSLWRKVGLRAEVTTGWSALATPSVIIPWSFSFVALESSGSRAAVQCSPRPLAPDGRTVRLGKRPWPFRRDTGLGGASWEAIMCPSCRTDNRPSSPSRTSTAAPA